MVSTSQKWRSQAYQKPYHQTWDWHRVQSKIVHVDQGGEFFDAELQNWFKEKGIVLKISAPDTHQQNGVAEQFNQTTHEHALAMLKEAGMANGFWPQAHLYVSYTYNWSPTWALEQTTPYKVLYSCKPDVSTLQIFGP